MEKIVAALWAEPGEDLAKFNASLLEQLPCALRDAGGSLVRINIRDEAVASGSAHIQRWQAPQQSAVVQFWLPSANPRFFREAETALAQVSTRHAAWMVSEATIIPNAAHPTSPGQRTLGWAQVTFLAFRPDLASEAAESHWRDHHTTVAIETQANFEYVQNRVIRALTPDAPAYDAFVEECFPSEALTKPQAFFDAVGDEEKFKANLAAMMDSCAGFIDFSRIDVIPTSQYNFT